MSDHADRVVLLDSEPLGLVSNPRASARADECKSWLQGLIRAGVRVMIPEIIDYEIRRELIRAERKKGLASLDFFGQTLGLLPCSRAVLIEAAGLWATAGREGYQTAANKSLDIDVILAATATLATAEGFDVVIATGNVAHLARYAPALPWDQVTV